MREFFYSADQYANTPIQKEIRDFCKDRQFDERTIFEYELLSEELLLKLIEAAGSEDKIRLKFKRVLGGTRITLSCGGKPIKLDPLDEDLGAKIIADYQDRIELIHRHQINYIDIQTHTSSNALTKQNLMAFALAVCCCVLLN